MHAKVNKPEFLADECVGLPTISFVRNLGYSLVTAKEAGLAGKTDLALLEWAVKEEKILITVDVDFGNILLYPPKLHQGVILLRFRHREENKIHTVLAELLRELGPAEFKKALIIVDAEKYRRRKE